MIHFEKNKAASKKQPVKEEQFQTAEKKQPVFMAEKSEPVAKNTHYKNTEPFFNRVKRNYSSPRNSTDQLLHNTTILGAIAWHNLDLPMLGVANFGALSTAVAFACVTELFRETSVQVFNKVTENTRTNMLSGFLVSAAAVTVFNPLVSRISPVAYSAPISPPSIIERPLMDIYNGTRESIMHGWYQYKYSKKSPKSMHWNELENNDRRAKPVNPAFPALKVE